MTDDNDSDGGDGKSEEVMVETLPDEAGVEIEMGEKSTDSEQGNSSDTEN
jgi:hypothetical protein